MFRDKYFEGAALKSWLVFNFKKFLFSFCPWQMCSYRDQFQMLADNISKEKEELELQEKAKQKVIYNCIQFL